MRKNLTKITILLAGLVMPFLAFGQTIEAVIERTRGVIRSIIPLLVGLAIIVFLWGIVKFITSAGDEEKRKSAVHIITYGIIGMFVMVAIWGIIAILSNFLGITPGQQPPGLSLPPITLPSQQPQPVPGAFPEPVPQVPVYPEYEVP